MSEVRRYSWLGKDMTEEEKLFESHGFTVKKPTMPEPEKCTGVMGLVRDLAVRPDFWFDVLIWPISIPLHLFTG